MTAFAARLFPTLVKLLGRGGVTARLANAPSIAKKLRAGDNISRIRPWGSRGATGLMIDFRGGSTVRLSWGQIRRLDPELARHMQAQRIGQPARRGFRQFAGDIRVPTPLGIRAQRSAEAVGAAVAGARGRLPERFGIRRNPLLAGLVGVEAARFAGMPLLQGASRSLTGEPFFGTEGSFGLLLEQQQQLRKARQLREMEVEGLQRLMAQNMARLAALSPQLYNQVLAGQRLPTGAVVLGGGARTDLLEQLALEMASGQIPKTGANLRALEEGEEDLLATLAGG